jgi:hypothetical protein
MNASEEKGKEVEMHRVFMYCVYAISYMKYMLLYVYVYETYICCYKIDRFIGFKHFCVYKHFKCVNYINRKYKEKQFQGGHSTIHCCPEKFKLKHSE